MFQPHRQQRKNVFQCERRALFLAEITECLGLLASTGNDCGMVFYR